jgi:hypothetical protein
MQVLGAVKRHIHTLCIPGTPMGYMCRLVYIAIYLATSIVGKTGEVILITIPAHSQLSSTDVISIECGYHQCYKVVNPVWYLPIPHYHDCSGSIVSDSISIQKPQCCSIKKVKLKTSRESLWQLQQFQYVKRITFMVAQKP